MLALWGSSLKLAITNPLPFALAIKASRGSSLLPITARCKPAGNSVGTSFMLWTAKDASPLRIASSISFTKSPLPPTCERGTSNILSPVVLILLSSMSKAGFSFRSSDLTHSACHNASLLPLVPIITLLFIAIDPIQFLYHRNQFILVLGVRSKRDGGRVYKFIDYSAGQIFSRFKLRLIHVREFVLEFLEFLPFNLLCLLSQSHNGRNRIQRGHPLQESLDFLFYYSFRFLSLLFPS